MDSEFAYHVIMLVLIGAAGGLAGGLFGIGGSVVMIPALIEVFGPNQHLYQAAAMIVNFFVAVPAVIQHYLVGAIQGALVARLVPFAAVAVVVGVGLSELPMFDDSGEAYLRGVFGAFLMYLSVSELIRALRRPDQREHGGAALGHATRPDQTGLDHATREGELATSPSKVAPTWKFAAVVAVPIGLIAGLLGVGGGLIGVPLQRRWLGVPMRTAVANSSAVIVATSLIGAAAKNYAYMSSPTGSLRPLVLAAILIPSAAIGSTLGSRLTHRLPVGVLKLAFFVVLLLASLRLIYGAGRSLQIL